MPFSIKDDKVKDLADELQHLTGAESRTDAIRRGLKAQIEIAKSKSSLLPRIALIQQRACDLHNRVADDQGTE